MLEVKYSEWSEVLYGFAARTNVACCHKTSHTKAKTWRLATTLGLGCYMTVGDCGANARVLAKGTPRSPLVLL